MANQTPKTEILFPVGRMVQGDLYKANTTDADGNPLIYKHGPDTGKPRIEYFFAVAFPKDGRPWWETEWGAKIFQTGAAAFPQGQATSGQKFAWKVRDGDDQAVNGKGKRNCDREGFPGHWIVGFSGGFPPDVYDANGTVQLNKPEQVGLVKRGYYVQVFGNVAGNGSLQQPGVYLNFKMVAFAFAGDEIAGEQDATAVGFGQNVVRPAGAKDAPVVAASPFAGQPGAAAAPVMPGAHPGAMPGQLAPGLQGVMPGAPMMPGAHPGAMPAMPGAAPGAAMPAMPAMPGAPAAAPVAVAPHTAYMAAPAMPGAPVMPAAPPAAPAPAVKSLDDRRTQSGMAYTVAQWFASGWNEQTLIANGHLLPY